jgi:hypothetical protein
MFHVKPRAPAAGGTILTNARPRDRARSIQRPTTSHLRVDASLVFGTLSDGDWYGGRSRLSTLRESLRRAVHACLVYGGILEGIPYTGNASISGPFGLI